MLQENSLLQKGWHLHRMVHPSVAQCGQLRLEIYDFVFSSEKKNLYLTMTRTLLPIIARWQKSGPKKNEQTRSTPRPDQKAINYGDL